MSNTPVPPLTIAPTPPATVPVAITPVAVVPISKLSSVSKAFSYFLIGLGVFMPVLQQNVAFLSKMFPSYTHIGDWIAMAGGIWAAVQHVLEPGKAVTIAPAVSAISSSALPK